MASNHINPKRIILDHYDELVREIDIHTEQLLERFTDDDVLADHWDISEHQVEPFKDISEWEDSIESWFVNQRGKRTSENVPMRDPAMDLRSIKVKDYVQKARAEMLAVLAKTQQDNLTFYELNKHTFKTYRENQEELKRELFSSKFCSVLSTIPNDNEEYHGDFGDILDPKGFFGLTLVVTDFYLPKKSLEPIFFDNPFLEINIDQEANQGATWWSFVANYVSRLLCLSDADLYILELTRQQILERTQKVVVNLKVPSFDISFPHLTHMELWTEVDNNFDTPVNLRWLPPSLEYIEMCEITFCKDAFLIMPNLRYLHLERCHLSELSSDWTKWFPSLRALHIEKCTLPGLNTKQLSELTHLSYEIADTGELPDNFFDHLGDNLQALDLNSNNGAFHFQATGSSRIFLRRARKLFDRHRRLMVFEDVISDEDL